MTREDEQLQPEVQSSPAAVNHDVEVTTPAQRFKLTIELPLFISILTISLSGMVPTFLISYNLFKIFVYIFLLPRYLIL